MAHSIVGLLKRYRADGSYVWHIDKRVKRYGRLCESTDSGDREEAERYLINRLRELREIRVYGERRNERFEMRFRNTWPRTRRRNRSIEMRWP
jgi:hypothetical protein